MAIKPTKPTSPPQALRSNPENFSANAEGWIAYQATTFPNYIDEIADFVDQMAEDALAAATGGDLPPLTGQAGKVLAVKGDESGAEFVPLRDQDNRIINGAFDFWQRGASFTTAAYGADRWINDLSGGTVTMSRQAFTVGDTLGSNSPTYFLRQTVSGQSGVNDLAIVSQPIEGVRSYAGQTITVLGWARRSSGSGNMVVEGEQGFGTGGSPSLGVTGISPTTVTLTSSWAPFAAVLTFPSISGKTLGTNNNDQLKLTFWTSAGSTYNARTNSLGIQTIGVDLWGVHIKVGTHTTAATELYKQPELGPELARCQRYFRLSKLGTPMTTNSNTSILSLTIPFEQPMRATPAATQTTTAIFGIGLGPNASADYGSTNSGLGTLNADTTGVARLQLNGLGAEAAANAYYSLFTAGKIALDSEL
jgi:hypothetical protein